MSNSSGNKVRVAIVGVGNSDFRNMRLEDTTFDNLPLACELKLEVWDSPNSAGVVIDAVRCARLALDRGIGGALSGSSSSFMTSPPEPVTDDEARRRTARFIQGEAAG